MSDIAVRTVGLGKMYRIGGEREAYGTLRDTLVRAAKRPLERLRHPGAATHISEDLWALRDIDLEVKQGEVLGIIGRNGSGKSTLLKVLSHITEPTEGRAEVRGRVASLLEVGTGFHNELTGRENIQLNGAILGMTRAEIRSKFDDIVEFSEIGRFLDTPVKRYSSGMYVRLAFAVAAHVDPDVMLIDEVLAVGDLEFRRKCMGKMRDVGSGGRSVVFVSHDMSHIRQLCHRVYLLDRGGVVAVGDPESICSMYESRAGSGGQMPNPSLRGLAFGQHDVGPRIDTVELRDLPDDALRSEYEFGESFDLVVKLSPETQPSRKEYSALWFLHDGLGRQLASGWSSPMDDVVFGEADTGMRCRVGPLSVPTGEYSFRLVLHVPHYENFDDWPEAVRFRVRRCDPFESGYDYPGLHSVAFFLPHKWGKTA